MVRQDRVCDSRNGSVAVPGINRSDALSEYFSWVFCGSRAEDSDYVGSMQLSEARVYQTGFRSRQKRVLDVFVSQTLRMSRGYTEGHPTVFPVCLVGLSHAGQR